MKVIKLNRNYKAVCLFLNCSFKVGKVKNRLDGLFPTGFKRSKGFLLKSNFVKSVLKLLS